MDRASASVNNCDDSPVRPGCPCVHRLNPRLYHPAQPARQGRVSLLAETRFAIYFRKLVDLRVLNYAHVSTRAGCEWNLARISAQRPGGNGRRLVRGLSGGRTFSSIKPKFRAVSERAEATRLEVSGGVWGQVLAGWRQFPINSSFKTHYFQMAEFNERNC